ncbi:MAG: ribonuclease R [Gammaproteobacteria bacterium]|nr:ribonuclease R [Gammaproteobacteria bacterium]
MNIEKRSTDEHPWQERDPEFDRECGKHDRPVPSRAFILKLLADHAGPLTVDELAEHIGLGPEDSPEAFRRRLQAMVRDGQLVQNRRGAYGPVKRMHLVAGVVSGHRDGYGFLTPDEGGPDIFLNPRQMRQLLPGDRVLVRISGRDARGRAEGAVVEVLERGTTMIVGRFQFQQGVAYVIPDNPRVQQDVLIPPDQRAGAQHGQMVVAELTEPPGQRTLPVGRITEVLGEHLAPGMEIKAAIRTHGIPYEWPGDVEREAAALPDEVAEADWRGREDLRALPLVTIDGEDARDFDDAVYAEPLKNGWRLVVAIADVSAYVRLGQPLDREASLRGTSVYFPQQVIPMLPEKLSNGLCSLNPQVERLCMVCDMRVDADGSVSHSRFYEAVMRSQARLTYTEVFDALENAQGEPALRLRHLLPHLRCLDAVFAALFAARAARGAIDFDTVETKVEFDAERKIERIVPVFRNRAHRIIEECMIAANVEAAKFVGKHKLPAPYRVHATPDLEKVQALREFLQERGLKLGGGDTPSAADYARTLKRADGRADAHLIQSVMLRSLMQARYSTENIGHFGLALEDYAHFTSPIRRFPDLLLHRTIKHGLLRKPRKEFAYPQEEMEALCAHSSTAERRADDAVRDVMTWLKCEFMGEHVGAEFDGVVNSVVGFGLFVELEGLYVEGLVHVSSLANDYYVFDSRQHCLRGERSGRAYTQGQRLRVRVVRVNLDERKIDLELAGKAAPGGVSHPKDRSRRR